MRGCRGQNGHIGHQTTPWFPLRPQALPNAILGALEHDARVNPRGLFIEGQEHKILGQATVEFLQQGGVMLGLECSR